MTAELPRIAAEDKPEQTASAVVRVAAGLFRDRGYHGTSMADIAGELGLSAPAIYHHFATKQEILFHACEAFVDDVLARTTDAAEAVASPTLKVQAFAREQTLVHVDHLRQAWELGSGMFSFQQLSVHLSGDMADRNDVKQRQLYRNLRDIVDKGKITGEFAPVHSAAVTFAVFGMVEQTVYWYRPSRSLSADEVADTHARFALRMLVDPIVGRVDQLSGDDQ